MSLKKLTLILVLLCPLCLSAYAQKITIKAAPCVGAPLILYGKEVRNVEIQIAAIQLATAVLALVTAVLALLPALGKAIRHYKRKRPKR